MSPIRVALVGCAHLHIESYVVHFRQDPRTTIVGIFDHDEERGRAFAQRHGLEFRTDVELLIGASDAVVICSENRRHLDYAQIADRAGKAILCEKPLATTHEEIEGFRALSQVQPFMTAFPCRYHPAWQSTKRRVANIGRIRAIVATNRGKCPGGWFVEEAESGGGAAIDHVVHVSDLLNDLLGVAPEQVSASMNNSMYTRTSDDCAMLTLDFPDDVFVTLDSSWSRPEGFRTWGDVTMQIIGDEGVVELDMFGPALLRSTAKANVALGLGSDADGTMIDHFIECVLSGATPTTDLAAGLFASEIAIRAYEAAREAGTYKIHRASASAA